jgi:NADPH:quinone reductase-like Zn-dependent oxidoreductase
VIYPKVIYWLSSLLALNYKDALSSIGNKGVTRKYPHTPGIDAVGTIISSKTNKFKADDKVIVTSYDLGMNTDGGFGQFISIPEIGLLSYKIWVWKRLWH